MALAIDIILWFVIALAILFLTIIWACILVASVTTIMNFIKQYKITSAELEKQEKEEAAADGPQYNF